MISENEDADETCHMLKKVILKKKYEKRTKPPPPLRSKNTAKKNELDYSNEFHRLSMLNAFIEDKTKIQDNEVLNTICQEEGHYGCTMQHPSMPSLEDHRNVHKPHDDEDEDNERNTGFKKYSHSDDSSPIPLCHNIVSTSQIISSIVEIDLQRLASLFPFTSYDRKRFAAITIRLANPHCTCLLFGSGKLVITGSTSFHACIVASQTITEMLREVNPR